MNADERRWDRKETNQSAEKHHLCLLMNFGKPKLEVRRIADNY